MNLQQEKALFLAQYLGQNIFFRPDREPNFYYPITLCPDLLSDKDGYLLLRSVNKLTDDEKLQVGIVAFPMFVPFPEIDYDRLRKLALTVLDRGHLGSRAHQLLVRYGVLVPFTYIDETGKPVTLHPDEIITLGWAKYQEA